MRTSKQMAFYLFISIFFFVGLAVLGWGLHSYHKGKQSLIWPETQGRITHCQIVENSNSDGNSTWKVVIGYNYKVAGKIYQGDKVAYGYGASSAYETHQAIYEKLRGASVVRIKYSPKSPSQSVIAPGVNRSTFVILAFATIWLVLTSVFAVIGYFFSVVDYNLVNQIKVIS